MKKVIISGILACICVLVGAVSFVMNDMQPYMMWKAEAKHQVKQNMSMKQFGHQPNRDMAKQPPVQGAVQQGVGTSNQGSVPQGQVQPQVQGQASVQGQAPVGAPQAQGITQEQAIQIFQSQFRDYRIDSIEYEVDHGRPHYEIEGETMTMEVEVKIDARTGEIFQVKEERR